MKHSIEIIKISRDRTAVTFFINGDQETPLTEYIDWFDSDRAEDLKIFDAVYSDEITRGWDSESTLVYKDYSSLDRSEVQTLIEFMYNDELYWGEMKNFDEVDDMINEAINTFVVCLKRETERQELELAFENSPKEGVKSIGELIKLIAA